MATGRGSSREGELDAGGVEPGPLLAQETNAATASAPDRSNQRDVTAYYCGTGRPSSSINQTIAGRGTPSRIKPLLCTHVLPKIQPQTVTP